MSPAHSRPLRYALAGMIAMAAAMGIGRFVFTPILPGMMEGLALSPSQAGLIASANYVGYLAGAVMGAGGWAHGHERRLVFGSVLASTALLAAMGFADPLWLAVSLRFLAGVASAFVMVFMAQIVFTHILAASRGDLQAVHFAGVGVGIAISSVMTGALHLAGADWRAAWFAAAAISLVAVFVVPLLARAGPLRAAGDEGMREPPLPATTAMRRVILAYGIFGAGYVVTATFLVAIVRQGDGGPMAESAVWLVTGLCAIPSTWFWGRVGARIGLLEAFALGCVVEAVGVAASVALPGAAGPLIGAALLGGTFVGVTAIGLQSGRLLAPAAPRRVIALMTASFGVGQILGPIAAGYAADWTGSFFAPSLGAALALLAAAAIGWSVRR